MEPQGQGTDNPILNGLREIAGGTSGFAPFVGMGLALSGQSGGPTPTEAAVAKGMHDLSAEYGKSNDPARAVLNWTQSPEGMAVMKQPGALQKVLDQFRTSLQPLNVTQGQIGQGNAGIVNPGGGNPPMNINQPTPIVNNVPPNNQSVITGPGSATAGPRTPGAEVQNFKDFAGLSNLSTGALSTIAGLKTTNDDFQRRAALGDSLLKQGASAQWVQSWVNGTIQMFKDDKVPNMFHWVDTIGDPTHMHTVIPQVEGVNQAPGIVPTWNTNMDSKDPSSYSSTPGQTTAPAPGRATPMVGQQTVPGANGKAQAVATKYSVPVESVKADNTIDPVKAWGPGATLALGGGLPAMAQNVAAHMARWFDPRATSEGSEQVINAEQGLQALQYLQSGLAEGSRVKQMVQAALGMIPAHEIWDDPASAANQLMVLRQTFEGEARASQENVKNLKLEGVSSDNSTVSEESKKLFAIQKVLNFLPSYEALRQEKRAIQDGKINNVPSIGTAASEGVSMASKAVGAATGTGNANPGDEALIDKVNAAKSPKDLPKGYGGFSPEVQSAIDAKIAEFRSKAAPRKAQAAPSAPLQPQAPVPYTPQSTSPGNPFGGLQ